MKAKSRRLDSRKGWANLALLLHGWLFSVLVYVVVRWKPLLPRSEKVHNCLLITVQSSYLFGAEAVARCLQGARKAWVGIDANQHQGLRDTSRTCKASRQIVFFHAPQWKKRRLFELVVKMLKNSIIIIDKFYWNDAVGWWYHPWKDAVLHASSLENSFLIRILGRAQS